MASQIHPTAIIDERARLGTDVRIGPYCTIGPDVTIGDGAELVAHVHVEGFTELGAECRVFPFASLGTQTQDLKYRGGRPGMRIGERTVVREYVTVSAATNDGDFTQVGSDCLLMAYAHVAHDCIVGDRVIMANCATLAGHIVVEDRAILGGLSAVHQFVRIGALSIIGGCSKVTKDVPPYMTADGHPLAVRGLNRIGLKRHGVSDETQTELKKAYRLLYRSDLITREALEVIAREVEPLEEIRHLTEFVRNSERGITK